MENRWLLHSPAQRYPSRCVVGSEHVMLIPIKPVTTKMFKSFTPLRRRKNRSQSIGAGLVALLATHMTSACVDGQATDSNDIESAEAAATADPSLAPRENPLELLGGHEPDDAPRLRREPEEA